MFACNNRDRFFDGFHPYALFCRFCSKLLWLPFACVFALRLSFTSIACPPHALLYIDLLPTISRNIHLPDILHNHRRSAAGRASGASLHRFPRWPTPEAGTSLFQVFLRLSEQARRKIACRMNKTELACLRFTSIDFRKYQLFCVLSIRRTSC